MDFFALLIDAILVGFGVYSLIYLLLPKKKRTTALLQFDQVACLVFAIGGTLGILQFVYGLNETIAGEDGEELFQLTNRMFGPYWFAYWGMILSYYGISQPYWFKKVRSIKWVRVITVILTIFSMERLTILITSFHRDYLPSSYTHGFWGELWHEAIFHSLIKWMHDLVVFVIITMISFGITRLIRRKHA